MRRCLATWPNAVAIVRGINNACAHKYTARKKMRKKYLGRLHIFIGPLNGHKTIFACLCLWIFLQLHDRSGLSSHKTSTNVNCLRKSKSLALWKEEGWIRKPMERVAYLSGIFSWILALPRSVSKFESHCEWSFLVRSLGIRQLLFWYMGRNEKLRGKGKKPGGLDRESKRGGSYSLGLL